MTQELTTLPAEKQTLLTQLETAMPADRRLSWLQLGYAKGTVLKKLEAKELELQQILLGWETKPLLELQTAIEAYKKGISEIPEMRKGYTKYLETIKEELMQPEKRVAALPALASATARYNTLRLDAQKLADDAKAKATEAASFKAHVTNEYLRIASQYKIDLWKQIVDAYTMALRDELEEEGIRTYVELTKKVLAEVKRVPATKFVPKHHKPEELPPLAAGIKPPNYAGILAEANTELINKFKTYHQDKANHVAASDFLNSEMAKIEAEVKQEVTNTTAVNNLMVTAGSVVVTEDTGIKQAVKVWKPKFEGEMPFSVAIRVMGEFLAKQVMVQDKMRLKDFGNLTVKQMASALCELGVKVEGVNYEEVVK